MAWIQELGINLQINHILYRFNTSASYYQECRKHDGIVFYVCGGHTIKWNGNKECVANESKLLYLPYESSYVSTLIDKGTEYYEIDFSIFQNGQQVSLLDDIQILTRLQSDKYLNEIKLIYELSIQEKPNYQLMIISKLLELCLMLCSENTFTDKKKEGIERIRRSLAYIQDNFDRDFTVKDLAMIDSVSLSTLEKCFLSCVGETPVEYRNLVRIRHAQMLLKGGFSVTDVAQRVGFSNRNYFTNVFKKITGTTPAKYRREMQVEI